MVGLGCRAPGVRGLPFCARKEPPTFTMGLPLVGLVLGDQTSNPVFAGGFLNTKPSTLNPLV